jgi:2-hydroxy-3-keto-5-methylthiopentenyl-1-phosphate phosphatase
MKTAVFCDFDGTISRRDVGYNIFHHFSGGKNDLLLPDWKEGRISTRECLRQEAAMVKATPEELYRFIDQFELNSGFVEFVAACDRQDIPFFVASDGLDFYIKHILEKNNLAHLSVVTNKANLENGGLKVEFPHENISCERCGICKGERIQQYRETADGEYRIVFIGDGYSDACGAREADVVFAKKDLEQYCLKNNIRYYSYDTFFDVVDLMSKLGYLAE